MLKVVLVFFFFFGFFFSDSVLLVSFFFGCSCICPFYILNIEILELELELLVSIFEVALKCSSFLATGRLKTIIILEPKLTEYDTRTKSRK